MAACNPPNLDNEQISKKIKLDLENGQKHDKSDENLFNTLAEFIPTKILSNNSNRKVICVQGKFLNKDDNALIILEKKAFCDSELLQQNNGYLTDTSILKLIFKNDVYYSCEYLPDPNINNLKVTIICPASEKHINKYQQQNVYLLNEKADIYENITKPHIEKESLKLDWVYNILDHKSESERIIFEDPDPSTGFILLPDLKWDGVTLETLYLLAITHIKGIKSIRDLNSSHLPLLKNIYSKGIKAIEEKYKLKESQLRIYFHYQPSFYHLHIHFTYLRYEAPGIFTEKAHMLTTVINNIELMDDYYQHATIPSIVRECDKLFQQYVEKGLLQPLN